MDDGAVMAAATSVGLASDPVNRVGIPGTISAARVGCWASHLCAWFAAGPGTVARAVREATVVASQLGMGVQGVNGTRF